MSSDTVGENDGELDGDGIDNEADSGVHELDRTLATPLQRAFVGGAADPQPRFARPPWWLVLVESV